MDEFYDSSESRLLSPRNKRGYAFAALRRNLTLLVLDNLLSLIELDVKQTKPALDNLYSVIGLDTNKRYRYSTILSALSDSIQTNITGLRQTFQSYWTRYRQTLPVLDNLLIVFGLSDSKIRDHVST